MCIKPSGRIIPMHSKSETIARPGRKWTNVQTALAAMGILVIGFSARMTLDPFVGERATFIFFVPAVIVGAAMAGLPGGLALTALGVGAGLLANGTTAQVVFGDYVAATVFIAVGISIAVGGGFMRRAFAHRDETSQAAISQAERLRSILSTVPDAVIFIDDNGIVRDFSVSAEQQFGWRAEEVIGQDVKMLMPSPYREQHDHYLDHYHQTGERRIIGIGRVVMGLRKDGSTFPMELSVGETRLSGVRHYTGFIRDLTEHQDREARMQALQSELFHVSRLTALGELASALAHEINQPLTAIANYMNGGRHMLKAGPIDHDLLEQVFRKSNAEAVRAGEIIRRLRNFVARGESDRRPEDLRKLVEEASALALVGARVHNIRVNYDYDPKVGRVQVDRIQIQQVLLNLLRNAIDAMADQPQRDLRISTAVEGRDMVKVSVSDTGTGVDADIMSRLFQPFTSSKNDGMGIGLSISRTIIEAHGGRIWLEPNTPTGAIFHITLEAAA